MEKRAICPECRSLTSSGRTSGKFYYNPEKGVGYCFHCHFKGKVTEEMADELEVVETVLAKEFNLEEAHSNMQPLTAEAQRYLEKRALADQNLFYSPNYHAIAIPNYREGELVGVKYRYIAPISPKERYIQAKGSSNQGFWIEGSKEKVLVVEGELDALSARKLGFKGTILALQTNQLSEYANSRLNSFKTVFLCLDKDEGGDKGLNSIWGILERLNPIVVSLPEGSKDINDLLVKEGIENGSRFLQKETRSRLEKDTIGVTESIPELLEFLSNKRNTRGDSTGYEPLDSLLGGGLRPSEMTVINAFAKTGKTSFINNIVHNLAKIGKRVGIASFEMDPARTLYPSLFSIAGKINIRTIEDNEVLAESVQLLSEECPYLKNIAALKRFGHTPWSELEEWATLMKDEFAIEYLVLDHAGYMVKNMTDADENQELAHNISKLSKASGLHILVVVQAPKTKDGLSIQTAYGGMAWGMASDNFITLERDKTNSLKTNVRLEAARYPGARLSIDPVVLFYNPETCELTKN